MLHTGKIMPLCEIDTNSELRLAGKPGTQKYEPQCTFFLQKLHSWIWSPDILKVSDYFQIFISTKKLFPGQITFGNYDGNYTLFILYSLLIPPKIFFLVYYVQF